MALTKTVEYDKTEIIGEWKAVQCRQATIIKENGVEISRTFSRHVLNPSSCVVGLDSDGVPTGTFTHTDTDISGEPAETQAVCAAVWTDAVKAAWKTHNETVTP
jgi:hypothetical protein